MPDPRDMRENLVELRDAINAYLARECGERLDVAAERMASHLVTTTSPAALAVAEAVNTNRRRFDRCLESRAARRFSGPTPENTPRHSNKDAR